MLDVDQQPETPDFGKWLYVADTDTMYVTREDHAKYLAWRRAGGYRPGMARIVVGCDDIEEKIRQQDARVRAENA